jgi:hypothetical protein
MCMYPFPTQSRSEWPPSMQSHPHCTVTPNTRQNASMDIHNIENYSSYVKLVSLHFFTYNFTIQSHSIPSCFSYSNETLQSLKIPTSEHTLWYKWKSSVPIQATKAYIMTGGIAPLFLNLSPRWRWVVSLTPGGFIPSVRAPSMHSVEGLVSSKACLIVLEKRQISCPCQDSNPRSSSPQPSHYTGCATHPKLIMTLIEGHIWIIHSSVKPIPFSPTIALPYLTDILVKM